MPTVNSTVAALCSHMTPHFCQTRRKLILVCDMDETLLTEVQNGEKILLRPKVCYMLRSLRNLYEVCLVTYSTRKRTNGILSDVLDPDGRIFGNRVLCREDIVPHFRNKLDAFLAHLPRSSGRGGRQGHEIIGNVKCCLAPRAPMRYGHREARDRRPPVWTYLVVLDDFPLAWSNLSTCIPIRPFLVNNTPRARSPKNEGVYVLSLQKFLTKLHTAVFQDQRSLLTRTESPSERMLLEQARVPTASAYSVVSKLRRRPSQAHRFRALCHLDPGRLIDFHIKRERIRPVLQDSIYCKTTSSLFTMPNLYSTGSPSSCWLGNPYSRIHNNSEIINSDGFMSQYKSFTRILTQMNQDSSSQSVSDENYSLGSTSKQLIRHVYRRAKLIREISAQLSGF